MLPALLAGRPRALAVLVRGLSLHSVEIPLSELAFKFTHASGPGGQNVNKLSTKVELRFDVARSSCIDDEIKGRLRDLAAGRLTKEGEIVIQCQTSRYQLENKRLCLEKLRELISVASVIPKERITTTELSQREKDRRIRDKRHRKEIKETRRGHSDFDADWD